MSIRILNTTTFRREGCWTERS